MTTHTTQTRRPHDEVVKALSDIHLNGSGSPAANLAAMVRNGNGAVGFDRDGVYTSIKDQIDAALRKEFRANEDPQRGIVYNFDPHLVYKMFGLDPRYNDKDRPILALMALNLEAAATNGRKTANTLLKETLQKKREDAVAYLDGLIEKHTAHESAFVLQDMYWWRENGGAFHTEESIKLIRAHVHEGSGITAAEATIALLRSGVPVFMVTNAPSHDLHASGFTQAEIASMMAIGPESYEPGKMLILTRTHLGEKRMKPDSYGFKLAAEVMGFSPSSSIFIGDTISDRWFAENSGARFVAVASGMGMPAHLDPNGHVFEGPVELTAGLLAGFRA
jgi:phosphoglycolate phosphatase-like HAD superfamily hydrolase